ncbi:MAG: hypothetical protein CMD49_04690, partial [Gammaproteobacteria bacterium]|nr:hypothetical protein [Gammaproteobacteria bacterium]
MSEFQNKIVVVTGGTQGIGLEIVKKFLANDCKKSKFDLYKFLQKNEVKGPHTKKIQEYLNDILDELVELLAGKDDQLNEGYSFLT